MKSWLIALSMGLAVATAQAQPASPAAPAGNFTESQRAEIVAILRAALRTDPTILRDAIASLRADEAHSEEAAARAAIARAAPAFGTAPRDGDATTTAAGDHVAGNPRGDVTIVEFYDVRCPYCRRMLPVMADLLHADPGVRLVFKDIPILGPASVLGARAVVAADRQGGYMAMHDALMRGTPDITTAVIRAAAEQAGLDWPRLERDMADPAVQTRLDANVALARALDIDGTPAYVIGDKLIGGATDFASLTSAVAAARKH